MSKSLPETSSFALVSIFLFKYLSLIVYLWSRIISQDGDVEYKAASFGAFSHFLASRLTQLHSLATCKKSLWKHLRYVFQSLILIWLRYFGYRISKKIYLASGQFGDIWDIFTNIWLETFWHIWGILKWVTFVMWYLFGICFVFVGVFWIVICWRHHLKDIFHAFFKDI